MLVLEQIGSPRIPDSWLEAMEAFHADLRSNVSWVASTAITSMHSAHQPQAPQRLAV